METPVPYLLAPNVELLSPRRRKVMTTASPPPTYSSTCSPPDKSPEPVVLRPSCFDTPKS